MRKTNIVKAFIIIALVLLIIAYTPAVLWWTGKVSLPVFFTYMRTVIHVGLLVAWAMSVYYRIIHKQVRRYLISIGGLMIFWLLIKTLKYYFVYDVDSTRMLWYAYYIPLLLIPTMGVLVALSLGKPENYRLPKWTNYFFICAVILVLLVLTNDFHNLVFIFPKGETGSDKNAAFNIIFLVVMAWVNLVGTVAIILIILKCRIPKSRAVLWLPLVSLSLTILYGILYLIKWAPVRVFLNDPTVTICMLFIVVLESCIKSGLIQANTLYGKLFYASSIGMQITDSNFDVLYTSESAKSFNIKTLKAAAEKPVIPSMREGLRLSGAPIKRGYVFWQEDVSELLGVLEELAGTAEELESYGEIIRDENRQKERRKKLEERKRLFVSMCEQISPQVELLTRYVEELEATENEETAKLILSRISVIGAYMKRRSNLIFLAEQPCSCATEELRLCLNESMASLRFYGVECACFFDELIDFDLTVATLFYDFFEVAVEMALNNLSQMVASFNYKNSNVGFSIMLCTDSDMSLITKKFPDASVEKEDGIWYCMLAAGKGEAFT
ncbi:MAG TPA: histidine kinase N-terminal 7TM domain-containing protein [Clostridia bacterium]|jgi:hypothetical protein|nr:histidine kinase N-terminal 7TM domain-containing protein [Clostridia bacterium]HQC68088.1 histidine kinase N-terminal 7TM domain-containing protein [Clostridia bacterium]